jgi:geranylgeranylglyceryl diphosphate synthase (EC 2.5.1.41)
VPEEMIALVKRCTDQILIVGGGIRSGEDAARVAGAGADVVVTGTVVENSDNVEDKIREIVEGMGSV